MADTFEDFEDELGSYVGPATTEDVLKELADHTPGQWVMRLTDADDELVWHKSGWSWQVESDKHAMFAVHPPGSHDAGNPSLAVDAPVVLSFAKTVPLIAEASRYTGGLTIRFGFGEHAGRTLAMVAWYGVKHLTESGDEAPGFGSDIGISMPDD